MLAVSKKEETMAALCAACKSWRAATTWATHAAYADACTSGNRSLETLRKIRDNLRVWYEDTQPSKKKLGYRVF